MTPADLQAELLDLTRELQHLAQRIAGIRAEPIVAVAEAWGLDVPDLATTCHKGATRRSRARFAVAYLMSSRGRTLAEIAGALGYRDTSAACNAVKAARGLLATDADFAARVAKAGGCDGAAS